MEAQLSPTYLGLPHRRVDARLKVTGAARYAAEHIVPDCLHGVLVTSAIAKGRIQEIDTRQAARVPGVRAIMTHQNAPTVPGYLSKEHNHNPRVEGQEVRVFYNDQIQFSNQPVALVMADTLEQAQCAAALVRVTYATEPAETDLTEHLPHGITPEQEPDYIRGQRHAYRTAPVQVEQTYQTPIQVHNPMETHAAIAVWRGDELTVYNKTQGAKLAQKDLMRMFQLPIEKVHVHSPFVGGAFGGSSRIWPHEVAAILGALLIDRPVKVMLARNQEFNMVGYRPESVQKVGLGALPDGTLVGITHEGHGMTSRYETFAERMVHPTKAAYRCPNLDATYRVVPLDMSTPCWTRGPGETSGSFALESAMDELAYKLGMDPLALRLHNFAETDPEKDKPWSSNGLRACYQQGAERFGWEQRNPEPRSMRQGEWLVGWGMSMGIYHASRAAASAHARLSADGSLLIQSGTADVGPGTATIMTQIAAEALGLAPEHIRFELGDAAFPNAPGQFGSLTAVSVGSAVHEVCTALKLQLQGLLMQLPDPTFQQLTPAELVFAEGCIRHVHDPTVCISYPELLQRSHLPAIEATLESKPKQPTHSGKSFAAHFVEVHVHPHTGEVRVVRVVSALDTGRVLNHRTALSQAYGAVVWGIGLALLEEAVLDHRIGRFVNHNLAEYHVPTNADIPDIDVILLNQPDPYLTPIGAKGMGEIGLVGFTAAIANAVFHATGTRVRELPITADKLL
ncbi:xanthine dehydrogenase family protein molybdopterin-binding subunit [Hymenobacter sp. NBH84]|uniref:xanthine dehydrogenase family protein molybdopterin-binding subunit n=1 Tax=Hymenobacter sp. NBH84 TaxID=2596915 RepID=UPI001627883C|nr:xanthine dehydrogenase family protein molybdopterin-binding subunit [Hymenobacter sp. NBH84]QNE40153.1 xanthine dehydrogenase family protein molybdopterin-binding subunit [Hymenobacter sp. NBH84]